jgi:hypothetical protein
MAKKFWLLALAVPVVLPGVCWAEIDISPSCRVKNSPPGRCGWCAVETLARFHGLRGLYGLAAKHASTCNPGNLEEVLAEMGVNYRIQYPGTRDLDILRYAVKHELGAAIGLRQAAPVTIGHIVTLVDLTDSSVRIIDSNDADCRIRQVSVEKFLADWDGFALVLEPESSWVRLPAAKQVFGSNSSTAVRLELGNALLGRKTALVL